MNGFHTVEPASGPIDASVRPPGSKSHTIRALVVSALAEGDSLLQAPLDADDTRAARHALGLFGVDIAAAGDTWRVIGSGGALEAPSVPVDVGASGLTARSVIALASLDPRHDHCRGEGSAAGASHGRAGRCPQRSRRRDVLSRRASSGDRRWRSPARRAGHGGLPSDQPVRQCPASRGSARPRGDGRHSGRPRGLTQISRAHHLDDGGVRRHRRAGRGGLPGGARGVPRHRASPSSPMHRLPSTRWSLPP